MFCHSLHVKYNYIQIETCSVETARLGLLRLQDSGLIQIVSKSNS